MSCRAALAILALSLAITAPALAADPADPADPPPDATLAEDEEREWACSSQQMEETIEFAEPRMVRVDGRMDSTLGIVFHSDRHVLTTFDAVFWGEALTVQLAADVHTSARVVAKDSENNLAILELSDPAKSQPFTSFGEAPRVGDPVFAVGRGGVMGRANASIFAGVVNGKNDGGFETDALEHSFFANGGPVFDCDDNLVGITESRFASSVISIAAATKLVDQIGKQSIYEGPVVRPHFEAGVVAHVDEHAAGGGISLGLSLVIHQGLEIKLKGGVVALESFENGDAGARVFGQTLVGYRLYLDRSRTFSFNTAAGLTFAYDRFCKDQCGEDDPPYLQRKRLMPTVEAGFQFWPGNVSYQYMVDMETPEMSLHQVMVGLSF